MWYCGSVQGLHCSFYEVLKLKAAIKFPISLWMSLQNVCFSEPELFWIVLWNHELLVYKCKYNQCHWIAGHSIFAFQLGALFVWWQLLFIYLFIYFNKAPHFQLHIKFSLILFECFTNWPDFILRYIQTRSLWDQGSYFYKSKNKQFLYWIRWCRSSGRSCVCPSN